MNLNTNIYTDISATCLISKEPITNHICLPCNHSYEYEYLYEEIKQQKSRHKQYFKCPYCRTKYNGCLLYTSPSPRDRQKSRMPSSA